MMSGQESQSLKSTAEMLPKQRCQDKTDPFVHLPDDIIMVVFEYCLPSERVECTGVSRLWRERILQLPVFRELRINLQRVPIERTEWEKGLQCLVTPALQQLTVTTCRGINPIVSILSKADCPRLSRLVIRETTLFTLNDFIVNHWYHYSLLDRPHMGAFLHVATRLTHLSIESEYRRRGVLRVLLALCPHLVHLEHRLRKDVHLPNLAMMDLLPDLPAYQTTRIQRLVWSNAQDIIHDVALIVDFCPDLSTFWLPIDPETYVFMAETTQITRAVDLISEHCTQLKHFIIGTDPLFNPLKGRCGTEPPTRGLKSLVYTAPYQLEPQYVENMLMRHQATLEYVNLTLDKHAVILAGSHVLVELPRLRHLCVSNANELACSPLSLFLERCHGLHTLVLDNVFLDDAISAAISSLQVHTFRCKLTRGDYQSQIYSIIKSWTLAKSCALTVLEIGGGSVHLSMIADMIRYLGRLHLLQVMTFSAPPGFGDKPPSTIQHLASAMKDVGLHNRLQYFKLDDDIYNTNAEVQKFVLSYASGE